ncbi:MAG: type II secretion system protein [Synechococcaceae cyanobacterium RM1_1_27]|nr:type II secretion system protein [Synechococcaceae cyanobacterium RM1_1_27]
MKGFTLLELIATLAIGSVLVAVAVPTSIQLFQRNQLSDSTNSLLRGYQLARSYARQFNENWQVTALGSVVSFSPESGCTDRPQCFQIELTTTQIDSFTPSTFTFRGEVVSDPLGSIVISHRSGKLTPKCVQVRTLLGVVQSNDGACL